MSKAKIQRNECFGSFSFILPVEWDFIPQKKIDKYKLDRYSISMNQRLNLVAVVEELMRSYWEPFEKVRDITENNWDDTEGFEPGNAPDKTHVWLYREFGYFTDLVRPLVYNGCDYKSGDIDGYLEQLRKAKPPVVVLKRKARDQHKENDGYLLLRKKEDKFLLYTLPLTSVQLRVYASGVMTLSICCNDELNASNTPIGKYNIAQNSTIAPNGEKLVINVDDIAWIRDAGRRLFWPFGCSRWDDHPSNVPVYSAIQTDSQSIILCDYRALEGWRGSDCKTITKPEYFDWTRKLICPNCISQMRLRSKNTVPDGNLLVISYFNDDRMFLHNTVVSEKYSSKVCEAWTNRKCIAAENLSGEAVRTYWEGMRTWYAIAVEDYDWNDASCQDIDMVIRKCEAMTDARWVGYGTMYALNYNSMTQLISKGLPFLSQNMDWMYYQMFLLAVMQHSSLQRFYREASGGTLARSRRKSSELTAALKGKYVYFMNRMWFTKVTEQEQGRDFFERMQSNMGLSEDMALLKDAIEELNALAGKSLDDAVNNALLPATWIELGMTVFTGLAIISTDSFGEALSHNFGQISFYFIMGAGAITALGMALRYLLKQDKREGK